MDLEIGKTIGRETKEEAIVIAQAKDDRGLTQVSLVDIPEHGTVLTAT